MSTERMTSTVEAAATAATAAAAELSAHLGPDRVLTPSSTGYSRAVQLWNGAVHRRPALVVRCTSTAHVQAAVRAARNHRLPLSVRGAGYDWAGRALREDGLVVDLSGMDSVWVQGDVAVVGGGATADQVVEAAEAHGQTAATGTVGGVGMAGLTLGGGYGRLAGRCGLASDNLLGAEVVLADGRVVTTDADSEPELLWALRGGGGNFGVVTSLQVRLHPFTTVTTGFVAFGWEQATSVARGWRELVADGPDDLTAMFGVMSAPDGGTIVYVSPAWCGDPGEGEDVLGRVLALGEPVMSQVAPMPVSAALHLADDLLPSGRRYAIRTRTLASLSDAAIAVLLEAGHTRTSPLSALNVHHFHGAAARVDPSSTAFGLRGDHLVVEVVAAWDEGDGDDHRAWADRTASTLDPESLPGGYPNLMGPEDVERAAHAYGGGAARLLAAKAHYDPDGVFTGTSLPPVTVA